MADNEKQTRSFSLDTETNKIIETFAATAFDGNSSMALRALVRHFAACQFPLLGIETPVNGNGAPK